MEDRLKKGVFPAVLFLVLGVVICSFWHNARAASRGMSIRLQAGRKTVTVGQKLRLRAKILHKKKGAKLVWKSSSQKIATVTKQGVVSGKKAGKVKISVWIRGTKMKRVCTIRVVKTAGKPEKTSIPEREPGVSRTLPPGGVVSVSPSMNPGYDPFMPTTSGNPDEKPTVPTIEPTIEPTINPVIPTMNPTEPTPIPGSQSEQPVFPTPMYVPENTELIPYSAVAEIQGEIMTVYLVNKNYEGQVRVRLNEKEFLAGGNAKDALMLLAYGGTVKTDKTGRVRLSRGTKEDGMLEEYWMLEDLEQGESYQMRAETQNSVKPAIANCGVIYFRGDVTSAIAVY